MARLEIETRKTIWYYILILRVDLRLPLGFLGIKPIMKIGTKTTINVNFKTIEIF